MTITVYYSVTFGAGDGSDIIDYDIELTAEETAAYKKAAMLRIPLNEVSELSDVLSRAYDEIEEIEWENACDLGDEYAIDCKNNPDGCSPFDSAWSLHVEFEDYDTDVSEEEAKIALTQLFSSAKGDYSKVDDYLERIDIDYYCDFDVYDLAEKIAKEVNIHDYE